MKTNSDTINSDTIVLACSGASDVGELTDRLARKLHKNGDYSMKCMAMIAADDKPLIQSLQKSKTLVIDGCDVDCGKKIMEEAWLSDYQYIRLTDYGYIKGQTPVTNELVDKIYDRIITTGNAKRIIHEKPVSNECCTVDNCDMFDFMSDHVGLKVLHPGGVEATRDLIGFLQPDSNKRVLDIACGKGRTSVYLAKKYGCRVVGIDIRENSIHEATRFAKKHKVDHLVSFRVADAHELPFESNSFDLTVAQAMLILVNDPIKVIQEATRVLKSGGRSGWLELSWKKSPADEFIQAASKEICAACISNVTTFEDWKSRFNSTGINDMKVFRYDMRSRGVRGMSVDEGILNGLKVMYKYMTMKPIRTRMKKLDAFFRDYPEYLGYGIYLTSK
jgi:arsenite methyltransferase